MPSYKRLFIWVEGNDDERFFEKVIVPKLRKKYDNIRIKICYDEKRENFQFYQKYHINGSRLYLFHRYRLRYIHSTDNITKEKFDKLIPKRFASRIDFMSEMLKLFSIEEAKRKNKSFKYFRNYMEEIYLYCLSI